MHAALCEQEVQVALPLRVHCSMATLQTRLPALQAFRACTLGASSNTSAADGVQPPPQPPNVEDYFVYDDEYSDDDGLFSDEEPYDSEEDDYDEWWDSHEERRAERLFGRRRLDEQGFTADWELFVAEHAEWDRQFGVAWREKEAADFAERQRAEAAARAAADAEQLERSALHAEAASYVASRGAIRARVAGFSGCCIRGMVGRAGRRPAALARKCSDGCWS